jgi:hypothetical protein
MAATTDATVCGGLRQGDIIRPIMTALGIYMMMEATASEPEPVFARNSVETENQ